MHCRHFTPFCVYIGNVNTVGKASKQLNQADYFDEMVLQKDSDDENKWFLIIHFFSL